MLNRPLYTYRDEANGVLDGGLFILAHGTNPQISLFVEARVDPKQRSKSVWQYTIGRSSHGEIHVKYDGKEVYEAPRGNTVSAPNGPYWLSFFNAALDADPPRP